MNLKNLEYLLAILETKSITKAAEECFISQSGMSQQLASIERELGVSLFQRVNHELMPTREGEIYLRYAREILGLHERALREITESANPNRGRILIGVSPERGNAMMQQIFPRFKQSFPNVQIQIIENHLQELEQMVSKHQLDISEASYVPEIHSSLAESVKAMNLYAERIMLVLPRNSYYQRKLEAMGAGEDGSAVDLCKFESDSFILPTETRVRLRSIVDLLFQRAGFLPKVAMETSNNASALNFVADSNYLSLVPQTYYYSIFAQTDRILYRTILQNPYWIRAIIYRREMRLTEAEKKLLALIREYHRPTIEMLKETNRTGPALPEI